MTETWECCLCDIGEVGDRRAFFDHCAEVHPSLVDGESSEGRRLVVMTRSLSHAFDGPKQYSNVYEWRKKDALVARSIEVGDRAPEDPMYCDNKDQ